MSYPRNPTGEPLDPTKMVNQPSLRTSHGLVWLIVGGLFAAASLIPFSMLAFAGTGRSTGAAIMTGIVIIALYAAMLISRFAVRPGPVRLGVMAGCMLAMALVALIGVWICLALESAQA